MELLIVIGIIGVLAALGLTSYSRARESAAKITCMSNLRQIGAAMLLYTQDNNQVFPFSGALGRPSLKEDWIAWTPGAITVPGKPSPTQEDLIEYSALGKYIRLRGPAYMTLMRCPSDDGTTRAGGVTYRYSYGMNYMYAPDTYNNVVQPPPNPPLPLPRVAAINRASEKVLAAEENERTINDGLWAPGNYNSPTRSSNSWIVAWDYLSVRHDERKGEFRQPIGGQLPKQGKRGNVLFVDGHVDYVPRKFAHSPQNLVPNNEGEGLVPNDPAP